MQNAGHGDLRVEAFLREKGVTLISAGLHEVTVFVDICPIREKQANDCELSMERGG